MDHRRRRRRLAVALGVVALPVLGLAGCNALLAKQDADRAATTRRLHAETRALVPDTARIVAEEESACVELRSFPSCVVIFLDGPGSYERRLAAVEERIRALGWVQPADAPSFVFSRGGLKAGVGIKRRGAWWDELCAGRDPATLGRYDRDQCLDTVTVRVM